MPRNDCNSLATFDAIMQQMQSHCTDGNGKVVSSITGPVTWQTQWWGNGGTMDGSQGGNAIVLAKTGNWHTTKGMTKLQEAEKNDGANSTFYICRNQSTIQDGPDLFHYLAVSQSLSCFRRPRTQAYLLSILLLTCLTILNSYFEA